MSEIIKRTVVVLLVLHPELLININKYIFKVSVFNYNNYYINNFS